MYNFVGFCKCLSFVPIYLNLWDVCINWSIIVYNGVIYFWAINRSFRVIRDVDSTKFFATFAVIV